MSIATITSSSASASASASASTGASAITRLREEYTKTVKRMNKYKNALMMLDRFDRDIICRDELTSLGEIQGLQEEYPIVAILLKKKALEMINKTKEAIKQQKMLIEECGSVEMAKMEVERLNIMVEEQKNMIRKMLPERSTTTSSSSSSSSSSSRTEERKEEMTFMVFDDKLDGRLRIQINFGNGVIMTMTPEYLRYEVCMRIKEMREQRKYLMELQKAMVDTVFMERRMVYEILERVESIARRTYEFMEKRIRDYRTVYDEVREIVDDLSFCIDDDE